MEDRRIIGNSAAVVIVALVLGVLFRVGSGHAAQPVQPPLARAASQQKQPSQSSGVVMQGTMNDRAQDTWGRASVQAMGKFEPSTIYVRSYCDENPADSRCRPLWWNR